MWCEFASLVTDVQHAAPWLYEEASIAAQGSDDVTIIFRVRAQSARRVGEFALHTVFMFSNVVVSCCRDYCKCSCWSYVCLNVSLFVSPGARRTLAQSKHSSQCRRRVRLAQVSDVIIFFKKKLNLNFLPCLSEFFADCFGAAMSLCRLRPNRRATPIVKRYVSVSLHFVFYFICRVMRRFSCLVSPKKKAEALSSLALARHACGVGSCLRALAGAPPARSIADVLGGENVVVDLDEQSS